MTQTVDGRIAYEIFRETEDRARLVIDSALDAFVAMDAGGAIIEWNKQAQAVFGWRREEAMGRLLAETIIPERYREAHTRGLERFTRTSEGTIIGRRIELTALHRDGREFPVELEISANRIPEGYFFGGFIRDISERLRVEQVLRESEAGLRRAQVVAKLAHVVTLPDGSFESFSESLAQLVGAPSASSPRSLWTWVEMIHADDRARVVATSKASKRDGKRADFSYRLVRRDGSFVDVRQVNEPMPDAPGAPPGRWFSTIQDITEEKRSAADLVESDRRFKGMLANIQLVSIMLDREARITYCNEYMLRLTGWRLDEVLGRELSEVFAPPNAAEFKHLFADLLADKPSAWHHENEIATRSGARRLIQWNNSVLRSASGEVTGTASIGEDITERRHAEWEVLRLNSSLERRVGERTAELQAANKELETFDYSISHDLRAPLSRIRGFGAALLEDFGDKLEPEARVYVERINEAGKQMDQLVDDLLQLSTITCHDLQRTPVDLTSVARSVLETLRKADPGREAALVLEPGLHANADAGLIRIVLENLLGNAWKFTARRASARIEFGRKAVDGADAFFVKDNGAGFESSKAPRLFEPFRRQHRQDEFKGTGIGLATVQRIVRRHGGKAWAEGAVDQGATFYFTLSA
jgi:PAS domain S-box-containing protein